MKKGDLHELIHSLSPSEKKYFTQFARRHIPDHETNYLRLFQTISSQKSSDDSLLKKQFRSEQFSRHLHVAKGYLYRLILRFLNTYHFNQSEKLRLKELLVTVAILYNKNLFDQCIALLKEAEKIAIKHESHNDHMEIKSMLISIYASQFNQPQLTKFIAKNGDENGTEEHYRNFTEYSRLACQMELLKGNSSAVDYFELKKKMQQILEHPLLHDDQVMMSSYSRLIYCYVWASYYTFLGKYDEALKLLRQFFNGYEWKAEAENGAKTIALALISDLLRCTLELKNYEDFKKYLSKFYDLQVEPVYRQNEITLRIHQCELLYEQGLNNFTKGNEILSSIEKHLQQHSALTQTGFYYQLCFSMVQFLMKSCNWNKALDLLTQYLSDKKTELKAPALFKVARMYYLLLHYELKNFIFLDCKIRTTEYFLKKTKQLSQLEKIILKFLRQSITTHRSRSRPIEIIKKFMTKINELKTRENFKTELKYYESCGWLDLIISKVKNSHLLIVLNFLLELIDSFLPEYGLL